MDLVRVVIVSDIRGFMNTLQIILLTTIIILLPIPIYLIATFDPSGPSSRDKDGYKK